MMKKYYRGLGAEVLMLRIVSVMVASELTSPLKKT